MCSWLLVLSVFWSLHFSLSHIAEDNQGQRWIGENKFSLSYCLRSCPLKVLYSKLRGQSAYYLLSHCCFPCLKGMRDSRLWAKIFSWYQWKHLCRKCLSVPSLPGTAPSGWGYVVEQQNVDLSWSSRLSRVATQMLKPISKQMHQWKRWEGQWKRSSE